MNELGHKELSSRVIEAAIEVHKALGPGFLESFYEEALCIELAHRGIRFERQKPVVIAYRGVPVGEHRVDLLIEESLLLELKAVAAIEDVFFAIGRSYLKALGLRDGLILNFAAMPLEIRRIGPGHSPAS
jgi:GxxExxY protein